MCLWWDPPNVCARVVLCMCPIQSWLTESFICKERFLYCDLPMQFLICCRFSMIHSIWCWRLSLYMYIFVLLISTVPKRDLTPCSYCIQCCFILLTFKMTTCYNFFSSYTTVHIVTIGITCSCILAHNVVIIFVSFSSFVLSKTEGIN